MKKRSVLKSILARLRGDFKPEMNMAEGVYGPPEMLGCPPIPRKDDADKTEVSPPSPDSGE